jgi:hypothetical protein
MEDSFFTVMFIVVVLLLAMTGAMFLVLDFRHFKEIAAQCEKQGYIQNDTTRIICTKEKPQ